MLVPLDSRSPRTLTFQKRLQQEVAAKEAAQFDALECKRVMHTKEEECEALKSGQLRLHKEMDILRAQIVENDRQHEEEVVRLRTGTQEVGQYLVLVLRKLGLGSCSPSHWYLHTHTHSLSLSLTHTHSLSLTHTHRNRHTL